MNKPNKGYKILDTHTWYGPGYCGICGDRDNLISMCVRWWDPDDGWKTGVLCPGCTTDAKTRPPRKTDYAYQEAHRSQEIDVMAGALGEDMDELWSETNP